MSTTPFISAVKSPVISSRKPDFSGAFIDLEGEVQDLTRGARLAQLQVHAAFGELKRDNDGNYAELPEKEAGELAVFAVGQVFEMARRLEELYDRQYDEAHAAKHGWRQP